MTQDRPAPRRGTCDVCTTSWNGLERLGVSDELQASVYRCPQCGTHWSDGGAFSYPRVLAEDVVHRVLPLLDPGQGDVPDTIHEPPWWERSPVSAGTPERSAQGTPEEAASARRPSALALWTLDRASRPTLKALRREPCPAHLSAPAAAVVLKPAAEGSGP